MQIAYLTTDDVNLDWAAQTASECGAPLAPFPPDCVMPNGAFAAVLYDLDHYDSQRGQAVLTELLSRPAPLPGLHGYSLGDKEMAALQANGVIVSQPSTRRWSGPCAGPLAVLKPLPLPRSRITGIRRRGLMMILPPFARR
jgi:hypothetical protein